MPIHLVKKITTASFFIGVCLLHQQVVHAQAIEGNAKLESATVYHHGAELHHLVQGVSLPAGTSELVINRIAQQVDVQSIRVTSSQPMITVLSASFERDYLNGGENKSAGYLENRKRMDDALAVLNDLSNQRKSEESALSLLEANKSIGGQGGVTPTQLKSMITYYRDQYKSISDQIVALKREEEAQQAVVNRLKQQIDGLDSTSQQAGQLVLRIASTAATKADLYIDYFTTKVSWSPFYEVKLDDLTSDLQLAYKADLVQNTGVDWKQVQLKFATGSPGMNNNAPLLHPWELRFRQPVAAAPPLKRKSALVLESAAVGYNAQQDMAQVVDNQLNAEFVVQTPYDIYSNGKPQSVQLVSHQLPAQYTYLAVPKQNTSAFLIGKVTGWDKLNLLPGNANLIVDKAYAGKSYIDPNVVTDTLNLSLGRDKRIVVQRKRIDEEGKTAFLGNSRRQAYTYEISLRNTRKETVHIEVKDQYPISRDKDIQVDLGDVSGANVNRETGELSWKLKLAPGETRKLVFGYEIKYPKDKTVIGL